MQQEGPVAHGQDLGPWTSVDRPAQGRSACPSSMALQVRSTTIRALGGLTDVERRHQPAGVGDRGRDALAMSDAFSSTTRMVTEYEALGILMMEGHLLCVADLDSRRTRASR